MTAVFSAVLVAFFDSGCWIGVAALMVALHVFVSGVLGTLSVPQWLTLFAMAFSAPAAALLAGAMLEKFSMGEVRGRCLHQVACLLAFIMMSNNNAALSYLEAALRISKEPSAREGIALLLATGSAVLFCAAAIAVSLMLFSLAFEMVTRWLREALGLSFDVSYAPLRPLFVVLGVTLLINLASGLFVAELSPLIILQRAH